MINNYIRYDGKTYSFPEVHADNLMDMSVEEKAEYFEQKCAWIEADGKFYEMLMADAKNRYKAKLIAAEMSGFNWLAEEGRTTLTPLCDDPVAIGAVQYLLNAVAEQARSDGFWDGKLEGEEQSYNG